VSRPVIAYKGPKLRHSDVRAFTDEYFRILAQLIMLGVVAGGRLAVVPPIDCTSLWISRNKAARHGIEQGPWRWDWRAGETQLNGAGVGNCTCVAPGAGSGAGPGAFLSVARRACALTRQTDRRVQARTLATACAATRG